MTLIRPPRLHVYIVDGTLSTLTPGRETHAGRLLRLLEETGRGARISVGYHPGVQGRGPRGWLRAALGLGLNDAIREGYARLASHWRPGDRIFLFGYSRGAYAVRSLAGMIGRVGLLRPEAAIQRRVGRAFRHYEAGPGPGATAFAERYCHHVPVPIEMIGVWDTVKALGIPWPLLSFLHPMATEFHDHALGHDVRHGCHALALDEDRVAFNPVVWREDPNWPGHLEQVWFPGAHADVGGQVEDDEAARPLANIPLVWMLERAETLGLPLPEGWRSRFVTDAAAPMVGASSGLGRVYVIRAPRQARLDNGERLDGSVLRREAELSYRPRAEIVRRHAGALPAAQDAIPGALPSALRPTEIAGQVEARPRPDDGPAAGRNRDAAGRR